MDFTRLDAFLEKMPDRGFPSVDFAIAKDGEVVYRKLVGYSDTEKTRPVSPSDLYWVFSCTKVITCVAAMRLVEAGVISLDDPVSKYIPEYANVKVRRKDGSVTDAENVMTVEHLFTMSGGLTYEHNTPNLKSAKEKGLGTVDFAREIAKDPLIFEPGTHYKYSLCHDVLAAVVEVAAGKRFSEYVQENIFTPLGMTDATFHPTEEQQTRIAAQYVHVSGTASCTVVPVRNTLIFTDSYDSGGAGVCCSANDFMKLVVALSLGGTSKDGYRLLKPETVKMMGENRLCDKALSDLAKTRLFGYGWGLCGRAHMNPDMSFSLSPVGEFGWDGATGGFAMVDPINKIAVFFATHVYEAQFLYHVVHPMMRNLVYEALEN